MRIRRQHLVQQRAYIKGLSGCENITSGDSYTPYHQYRRCASHDKAGMSQGDLHLEQCCTILSQMSRALLLAFIGQREQTDRTSQESILRIWAPSLRYMSSGVAWLAIDSSHTTSIRTLPESTCNQTQRTSGAAPPDHTQLCGRRTLVWQAHLQAHSSLGRDAKTSAPCFMPAPAAAGAPAGSARRPTAWRAAPRAPPGCGSPLPPAG